MKRILKLTAVALLVVLGSTWGNNVSAQADDNDYYEEDYRDDGYDQGYRDGYRDGEVSYQTFYDELSPHGRWVDYPEYGYVWIPNAGPGFRPYSTNGHWVWTDDYEWMWVSDYRWGWATFHYGRWFYDPFYGWVWVPGYEWSPAWVAWRHGGDYYGWAPLRPGIHISIGFSIGSYSPPYDYWCFAPRRYIASRNIYNYYVDRSHNVSIINQTTIINNYNYSRNVYRTGPRRMEAERYAGRITPVRFRESSRPGRATFRNNEVSVYRPRVTRDENRRFAPRNVERYDSRGGSNNRGVARNDNRITDRNNRSERNNDTRVERNNPARERAERNNPARERMERRVESNGNGNGNMRRENGNIDARRERGNAQQERRNEQIRQPQENRNSDAIERRRQMAEQRNRSMETNRQQGQNENRVFRQQERTPQANPGNGNRQFDRPAMERGNAPQVREPRREMRTESRPAPQMERRPQQQSQPQQRQIEQRPSAPSSPQGNGGGGGNGRGRRGRD